MHLKSLRVSKEPGCFSDGLRLTRFLKEDQTYQLLLSSRTYAIRFYWIYFCPQAVIVVPSLILQCKFFLTLDTAKSAEIPVVVGFSTFWGFYVPDMYHLGLTSVGLLGETFWNFSALWDKRWQHFFFHESSESDTVLESGRQCVKRESRERR